MCVIHRNSSRWPGIGLCWRSDLIQTWCDDYINGAGNAIKCDHTQKGFRFTSYYVENIFYSTHTSSIVSSSSSQSGTKKIYSEWPFQKIHFTRFLKPLSFIFHSSPSSTHPSRHLLERCRKNHTLPEQITGCDARAKHQRTHEDNHLFLHTHI